MHELRNKINNHFSDRSSQKKTTTKDDIQTLIN